MLDSAMKIKDQLISWRRDLHMHPEMGFREKRTAGVVAETLSGSDGVVAGTTFGSFELDRVDGRPGIVIGRRLGERLLLAPGSSSIEASGIASGSRFTNTKPQNSSTCTASRQISSTLKSLRLSVSGARRSWPARS